MSSGADRTPWSPGINESGTHPADEARYRACSATIALMTGTAPIALDQRWRDYMVLSGSSAPPEHDWCYPPPLIDQLVAAVVAVCHARGLRPFMKASKSSQVAAIARAWSRFRADPGDAFTTFQAERVRRLRASLAPRARRTAFSTRRRASPSKNVRSRGVPSSKSRR